MLRLHERFDERIDEFKTYPSRFDMRKRHPYRDVCETKSESSRSVPLSPEEKTEVEQMVSSVENPSLRRALEKAMVTDREWKKGERS